MGLSVNRPLSQVYISVVLCSENTGWWQCVGLFALALIGQVSVLNLISSPPWGVYHRYLPWREVLEAGKGLPLIILLMQTGVVLWAAHAIVPGIKGFLRRYAMRPKVCILILILAFVSVKFTADVPQYIFELVMVSWVSLMSLLTLILFALTVPEDSMEKVRCRWRRWAASRYYPHVLAAWVVVVSGAVAWFVFDGVPHIADDVSYLFQAKYFSEGLLYLPAPPDKASFEVANVINDGVKWYGYGFPGWPAVLALGVLAGAPWIVNPLLGGMTVLLAYSLVQEFYARPIAVAVITLLAVSPWFIFMSASFMAHPLTLIWTLLSILALKRAQKEGSGPWGIFAGVCLGGLFLTRPLEGVLIGAAIGLWALFSRGRRILPLAGFVTAAVVVGSLALVYNFILTGDALYAPHMKWTDETWYRGADRIGFGPTIGNLGWTHLDPLPGHGLLDVIINANSNFYMANADLFGWSFGSLLLAAVCLIWKSSKRHDWLFVGLIISTVVGHSFFWFSGGPDIGARYWYQTLVPLTLLSVQGALVVRRLLIPSHASPNIRSRVTAFVVAASLTGFITVVPWRSLTKYCRYRDISADVDRLARKHNFGNALVFVRQIRKNDYASAFVFNPARLESDGPIYVLDAGPSHRATVLRSFPSRSVWLVGRSSTRDERMKVLVAPVENLGRSDGHSSIVSRSVVQR